MNMSTARAGRSTTRTISVAAAAVATVALLAACSGSSDDASTSDTSSSSKATTAEASGEVTVIDQTNLLLATAQETLEARGLVVDVADASGQGRPIDDPTTWVVVTQDPISGTVEAGSTVTLTARMTTDPAS
jgi:ABC-type phosphate transport system substrate-binding protein